MLRWYFPYAHVTYGLFVLSANRSQKYLQDLGPPSSLTALITYGVGVSTTLARFTLGKIVLGGGGIVYVPASMCIFCSYIV